MDETEDLREAVRRIANARKLLKLGRKHTPSELWGHEGTKSERVDSRGKIDYYYTDLQLMKDLVGDWTPRPVDDNGETYALCLAMAITIALDGDLS